jgi:hypothetical protein
MRAVVFCLLLSLSVFTSLGQAEPRVISLDFLGSNSLEVYQNTPVKVSNPFQVSLYDLTVTKPSAHKDIVSVSVFLSGESFDLAFSKVGTYEICFSKVKNEARTCLTLDVLKRIAT